MYDLLSTADGFDAYASFSVMADMVISYSGKINKGKTPFSYSFVYNALNSKTKTIGSMSNFVYGDAIRVVCKNSPSSSRICT